MTGDNYSRAWALLSKYYENKKELTRSNFVTVAKMKSDTAEGLSRIYNAATSAVNEESIERSINSYGLDLLNHLVVELFNPKTRLKWESYSSESTDPPDHETLRNFIMKRTLTLNATKSSSIKVSETRCNPRSRTLSNFALSMRLSVSCGRVDTT